MLKSIVYGHPQNKPQIYISCHPVDRNVIPEIAARIQQKCNCVVWYDDGQDKYETSVLEKHLKRMQLIVFLVSNKLITNASNAIDFDLTLAKQNHIPVLPILIDECNLAKYNQLFENRQYLTSSDYMEGSTNNDKKLGDYLDLILVSDSVAEHVRNAFDAYIFLSYRKRDSEYAIELIRQIRSDKRLDSVAIWYDDYLIPGEDFNQTIRNALYKSKLFILTITNNILEKDNYVLKHEYPMALESDKVILPVEMETTDRTDFDEILPNLPEIIDFRNKKILTEHIFDNIKEFITTDNSDLYRNYYIGLAYLSGIDVEINYSTALSMITFAAENNLVDAIEKLVYMYRFGNGVEINRDMSIQWHKKLLSIYESDYHKNPSDNLALKLSVELEKYAAYCIECGEYECARHAYERVIELGDIISENTPKNKFNVTSIETQAIGMTGLGDIKIAEQKHVQAKEYYIKAYLLVKTAIECVGNGPWLSTAALILINIGNVKRDMGYFEEAIQFYTKARQLVEHLNNDASLRNDSRMIMACYNKIADIYLQSANKPNDLKLANESINTALQIGLELFVEYHDTTACRDLSISYERLGGLALMIDDYETAKEAFENKLELVEKLTKNNNSMIDMRDLSLAYEKLGFVELEKGEYKRAEEWLLLCLDIRKKNVKLCPNSQIRRDLFVIYCLLADLYEAKKEITLAKNHSKKALGVIKKILNENDAYPYQVDLLKCYCKLALIEKNINTEQAKKYFIEGAKIALKLITSIDYRGIILEIAKIIYNELNNLREGAEYDDIISNLKQLCDSHHTQTNNSNTTAVTDNSSEPSDADMIFDNTSALLFFFNMSQSFWQMGNQHEACECMNEGINTALRILEVFDTDTECINLASKMCVALHQMYANMENCEKNKEKCLSIAVEIQRKLLVLEPTETNRYDLATALAALATENKKTLNIEYLDEAIDLMADLCKINPDNKKYLIMYNILLTTKERFGA